ncbi:MAG: hypothetical protein RL660_2560 [Bacteroidota bacterium]|jgi:hypothetical protein
MQFKIISCALVLLLSSAAQAQISGELQSNVNFFQRDSNVKASGNPLYNNFLSGGENWLALRYNGNNGFNANVRIDAFHNSNLLVPTQAYSAAGVGMFNVSKEWDGLTLTAGHIYDQIGTGILYRAYEDRPLLIDNATFGFQAKYTFKDKYNVKTFAGQQRNLFDRYKPILKAINVEADYDVKDVHLTPGIGVLNRTLDDVTVGNIVGEVNSKPEAERFTPTYNMYAATFYNTLTWKDFSWYFEAAVKSKDAVKTLGDVLVQRPGTCLFGTWGYARTKWGINVSGKRTDAFVMRTTPYENPLRCFSNWQPIIALIRPQRTIARYTPQSLDYSEFSKAANLFFVPSENYSFNATYTHIDDLDGNKLYRELYADAEIRSLKNFVIHAGVQVLNYNQEVYQLKGKMFNAITPFTEITYKLSEKRSIKTDIQYMAAQGDYGSWIYALLEYDIAPKWAIAVADMYNTTAGANFAIHPDLKKQHYPNVFVAHTRNAHRFTAQYVKQVEGINCTGGVCRYEPAFSGFKFGITSSF